MKKILFYIILILCGFVWSALAQETPAPLDDEVIYERTADGTYQPKTTGFAVSLLNLFKLYRHFEQNYPDSKIDGDLAPEIRRLMPNLSDQEVYDQEWNIKVVIKSYREINKLIAKIKAELLVPPTPPIEVSLEELKLYDEPYIEAQNELVVIYDPMKIVPYATDKKNFLATELAYKKSKIQSKTAQKFAQLKNQISELELKKLPFYNIIYPDPFTGTLGIGDWNISGNAKVRILHTHTAIGDNNTLKTALNIYVEPDYFVLDKGANTFNISLGASENVKTYTLFRPLPQLVQDNKNLLNTNGYIGGFIAPLETLIQDTSKKALLAPEISFSLCNNDLICTDVILTPKLEILAGKSQKASMNNLIEQSFNTLPKSKSDDLKLVKSAIYTDAQGNEFLKIKFQADSSPTDFVCYVSADNNLELSSPIISIQDDNINVIVYPQNKKEQINTHKFEVTARLNNRNVIRQTINPDKASIFDVEKPTLNWGIIWLAFIGGLLLNFMPCVFPVLGLKIISLTKFGAGQQTKVRKDFFYTLLGIISAFVLIILLLLLLKYTGISLGWGVQFQNVEFLIVISFILVVFLLQACGQINLNTPQWVDKLLRLPSHRNNMLNYLTGLLLVLLSTPCSAPYLGTALGFALSGGYFDIIVIMCFMGLGLAMPYYMLFFKPQWACFVPHPNRWINLLIHLMTLMLLLTLVWLIFLISSQVGFGASIRLSVYLLIFGIIWCFAKVIIREINKNGEPISIRQAVRRIVIVICLVISFLIFVVALVDGKISQHQPTSTQDVLPLTIEQQSQIKQYLQDNKVVLIALGADWCMTCKANELLVLNNFKFQNLVKEGKLILINSTQTQYSPQILDFMEKYGRKSLPFYLLYTPKIQSGIVLPELLNDSELYRMILESRY